MTKKIFLTISSLFMFLHFMYTSFGTNWIRILSNSGAIYSIRVNPQSQNIIYAGGTSGVWKSTNAGQNWTLIGPSGSVQAMDLCREQPSVIYAGTGVGGGGQSIKHQYSEFIGGTGRIIH